MQECAPCQCVGDYGTGEAYLPVLQALQRHSAACRAGREKPRAFAGNTYTCLSACAAMPCVMSAGERFNDGPPNFQLVRLVVALALSLRR